MNAADNGFTVGTYEDLIPTADLVCNNARQTAYCSSYCHHALDEERIDIILFTWF
jgi:ketol-acid reductoisomerase